jgi:hypothetical protein
VIERVGRCVAGECQDIGIEYYRYVPQADEFAHAAE